MATASQFPPILSTQLSSLSNSTPEPHPRPMHEKLQQRLQSLKTEYAAGQKMLADLEAQQANLRDTLLRISGAIQVLEETLSETESTTDEPSNIDNTTNLAQSIVSS